MINLVNQEAVVPKYFLKWASHRHFSAITITSTKRLHKNNISQSTRLCGEPFGVLNGWEKGLRNNWKC